MQDEATYICDACGEEIVVPVDVAAGADQGDVELPSNPQTPPTALALNAIGNLSLSADD